MIGGREFDGDGMMRQRGTSRGSTKRTQEGIAAWMLVMSKEEQEEEEEARKMEMEKQMQMEKRRRGRDRGRGRDRLGGEVGRLWTNVWCLETARVEWIVLQRED